VLPQVRLRSAPQAADESVWSNGVSAALSSNQCSARPARCGRSGVESRIWNLFPEAAVVTAARAASDAPSRSACLAKVRRWPFAAQQPIGRNRAGRAAAAGPRDRHRRDVTQPTSERFFRGRGRRVRRPGHPGEQCGSRRVRQSRDLTLDQWRSNIELNLNAHSIARAKRWRGSANAAAASSSTFEPRRKTLSAAAPAITPVSSASTASASHDARSPLRKRSRGDHHARQRRHRILRWPLRPQRRHQLDDRAGRLAEAVAMVFALPARTMVSRIEMRAGASQEIAAARLSNLRFVKFIYP